MVESILYQPVIFLIKISILLQFVTVFVANRGSFFHYLIHVIIWCNAVFYIIVTFLFIYRVSPTTLLTKNLLYILNQLIPRKVRASTKVMASPNTRCVPRQLWSRDHVRGWQRGDGFHHPDTAATCSLTAADAAEEEDSIWIGFRDWPFRVYRQRGALRV